MASKTKLKWRLAERPTPEEVRGLLKDEVITKEEAREILFSLETEEDRSKKSLQDEIKFLRELVAKLSTNRSVIIETIREVEKPWKRYDWYQPYYMYATNAGTTQANTVYAMNATAGSLTSTASNLSQLSTGSNQLQASLQAAGPSEFTDIKTF